MPEEQDRSLVIVVALNSYGFKKLIRLADKAIAVSAVDSCRAVPVEEDARARCGSWEVLPQPKAPFRAAGGPPGVPSVLFIVLVPWIETMNSNDAERRDISKCHQINC